MSKSILSQAHSLSSLQSIQYFDNHMYISVVILQTFIQPSHPYKLDSKCRSSLLPPNASYHREHASTEMNVVRCFIGIIYLGQGNNTKYHNSIYYMSKSHTLCGQGVGVFPFPKMYTPRE